MAKKKFEVNDLYYPKFEAEQEAGAASGAAATAEVKKSRKPGRKPSGVAKTLRSWQIEDELWEDFMIYVNLHGGNQGATVNALIREKLKENAEQIAAYKSMTNGD